MRVYLVSLILWFEVGVAVLASTEIIIKGLFLALWCGYCIANYIILLIVFSPLLFLIFPLYIFESHVGFLPCCVLGSANR